MTMFMFPSYRGNITTRLAAVYLPKLYPCNRCQATRTIPPPKAFKLLSIWLCFKLFEILCYGVTFYCILPYGILTEHSLYCIIICV